MNYIKDKIYHIVIPYQDCKKWLKISVKYVNNPDNLNLNTLKSDYPILKYLVNNDFDIEKALIDKIEVLDVYEN